jgi:hypothetical protein
VNNLAAPPRDRWYAGGMDSPGNHDRHQQEAEQQLRDTIGGSHEVLVSATTVFPFTPFPDTITVDREKISVTQRFFFRTAEVVSIRIEDILNVTADIGPFMGSIKLYSRYFSPEPHEINYLRRRDTIRIKCIVQGYIIAIHSGIDSSTLSTPELARLLNELGQTSPGDL